MKLIKLVFIFSILAFSFTFSCGQSWVWAKQGISDSIGEGFCGAIDTKHNVYLCGQFAGRLSFGSDTLKCFSRAISSQVDIYIAKYDSGGNFLFAVQSTKGYTYWPNGAPCIITDSNDNLFVTGSYYDSISFGGINLRPSIVGNFVSFLVKYNSSGNTLWAKQCITPSIFSFVESNAVTADNSGNIYIAGVFNDTAIFANDSLICSSNTLPFIIKYNTNGNVIWAKQAKVGGVYENVSVSSLFFDNSGFIYMAGTFSDTLAFGSDTLINNGFTGFLVKYDLVGNVIWAVKVATSPYSSTNSIIGDKSSNIYVAGFFSGITRFGPNILNSPNNDIYLAKFDKNGNLKWVRTAIDITTLSNSTLPSVGYSLAIDTLSNIYLSTGGAYFRYGVDTFLMNTSDPAQIMKLDTSGNLLCASNIASGGDDENQVVVDHLNNHIYFVGDIESQTILGSDTLKFQSTGSENPFIARWEPCCKFSAWLAGDTAICKGMSIVLKIYGGTSYNWNSGATSDSILIAPDSSTIYSAAVKEGVCSVILQKKMNVYAYPIGSISGQNICFGDTTILSAYGGVKYKWNTGDTASALKISPRIDTIYNVIITANNCSDTVSRKIIVNPTPTPIACCDSSIVHGQNVQLISSGGGSYSWSPNTSLNCDTCPNPMATPIQTTTYTLTVISDSGCVATKYITIDVRCGDVFVPDAFSPNANYNTMLYVRGPCIAQLDFIVFDRWGNKIFESQNPDRGWDGNHDGTPMNMGTYMYYAKATMYDGSTIEKYGNVTLLR